jgi:DNA-binding CsgD family transcriptional regulator
MGKNKQMKAMNISKEELEKAIASGKTLASIGRELGISRQLVSKYAKEYNIATTGVGRPKSNKKMYRISIEPTTWEVLEEKGTDWVRKKLDEIAEKERRIDDKLYHQNNHKKTLS